jgi:hypothetical protein
VDLFYIEYNAACAEKWKGKTEHATIYAGDQADEVFLEKFIAETTANGLFDIIVDDGGHSMEQQNISLKHLWRTIKPGGYYFIEDLHTSYLAGWHGDPTASDPTKPTMMKDIYGMIDDIMVDGKKHPISAEIRSIECMRQICLLIKKMEGAI